MLLDLLGDGDTLAITRIDRLACSLKDLQDIASYNAVIILPTISITC